MISTFFIIIISSIIITSCITAFVHYNTVLRLPSLRFRTPLYIASIYSIATFGTAWLSRNNTPLSSLSADITGILMGFGYYALIGAIITGAIWLVYIGIKRPLPRSIGRTIFVCSLLAATIGHIMAQYPVARHYAVEIVPESESTQTTIATLVADSHFGPARNKRLAEKTLDIIRQSDPDMILFAGDMYDGPEFDLTTIASAMSQLPSIAPVFYSPGNHEEYGPYDEFIQHAKSLGFRVLIDEVAQQDNLTIAGLAYRTPDQQIDMERAIEQLAQRNNGFNNPTIAIHHSPIFLQTLRDAGVDLSVHGHTHRGQFCPNNLITRQVYGIYHYGMNMLDNMFVVTTSGIGTAGPAMRLCNPPEIAVITIYH